MFDLLLYILVAEINEAAMLVALAGLNSLHRALANEVKLEICIIYKEE
jgi:hypothetical protein